MKVRLLQEKTDQIVERVVVKDDEPELISVFFPEYSSDFLIIDEYEWDIIGKFPEFYCLYIDSTSPKLITGWGAYEGFDAGFDKHFYFKDFMVKEKPSAFWDIAFLLAIYDLEMNYRADRLNTFNLEHNINTLPIVDDILSLSRGVLLWKFQLEHLAGLFLPRPKDRIQFRKDFNARSSTWKNRASKMLFTKHISLFDVVEDRIVAPEGSDKTSFGLVHSPIFDGANLLFRELFSVAEQNNGN